MRSAPKTPACSLVRIACSRCDRLSAFVSETGLCPFCRAADLEREHGLRPGLFRALTNFDTPTRASSRRRRSRRRISRARVVVR